MTGSSSEESLAAIVYFLLFMAYMIFMESNYSTTIGKRLMKIQVRMENGEKLSLRAAVIRNLLRLVDALPHLYIVGIIVITVTKKKQRVGDLVANTVVVRSNSK